MALTLLGDDGQNSANVKRRTQLERWENSDTNQELPYLKKDQILVKFPEDCVFLAACSQGDTKEVKRLIDLGCNINTGNVDGLTALHQACIDGKLDMVQFLTEHGAYLDVADNEGWTPLHATSNCGYLDIARYLLDHGANCVACNSDGELPVDITDDPEMRELLVKHMDRLGLDPDAARHEEEEVMYRDAQQWSKDQTCPDTPHPKTGATALHVAAAKNYAKVIKVLIDCSCNLDAFDCDGWAPIHAAAHWGQEDACRLLAENMCNMEAKTSTGQTVFDVAPPELLDLLQELKEKQVMLRKDNPVITNRPHPPLRRRSSVTRLSRDEKQNLVQRNVEEERAQLEAQLLKDESNKVKEVTESESSESDTETQNEINKQNEDTAQDGATPRINDLAHDEDMEPVRLARPEPFRPEPARKRDPSPEEPVRDRAPKYSREETPEETPVREPSPKEATPDRELKVDDVSSKEPSPMVSKESTPESTSSSSSSSAASSSKESSTSRESTPQESAVRDEPTPALKEKTPSPEPVAKEPSPVRLLPPKQPTPPPVEPTKEVNPPPKAPSPVKEKEPVRDIPVIESRKPPLIGRNEKILPEKEKPEPTIPHKQETELSSLAARRRAREERIAARRMQAQQDNVVVTEPTERRRLIPPYGIYNTSSVAMTTSSSVAGSNTSTVASSNTGTRSTGYVPYSTRRQLSETIGTKTDANNKSSNVTNIASIINRRNQQFTPPQRDEETETQRKTRARRARETRRSTQGVTMEDLEKAQETSGSSSTNRPRLRVEDKVRQDDKENKPDVTSQSWRRQENRKDSDPPLTSGPLITATSTATTSTTNSASTTTTTATTTSSGSTPATTGSGSFRSRLGRENNADYSRLTNRLSGEAPSSAPSSRAPVPAQATVQYRTYRDRLPSRQDELDVTDNRVKDSEKEEPKTSSAIRARRRREERRSTGKVDWSDIMEADKQERKRGEEEKNDTDDSRTSDTSRKYGGSLGTSDYSGTSLRDRPSSPYYSRSSTTTQPQQDGKDYKKLYEDERLENERIKLELSKTQQELAEQKSKLDELRKERRALDRKMSEKDEELKTMTTLKEEIKRLKEENGALIRVISKLSK